MSFILENYAIFLIIAIVLLLGLFGYMMDRKRYEKYRQEIINEERVANAMESVSNIPIASNAQTPMQNSMNQAIPTLEPVQMVQQPGQMTQPVGLSDPNIPNN